MISVKSIENMLQKESFINITGESGVGKTTFALQYVGKKLKKGSICIWVQASEKFPKNRFLDLFSCTSEETQMLGQIILTPGFSLIQNLDYQERIISEVIKKSKIRPFRIQFIVIDNISHHLRTQILRTSDIVKVSKYLDHFFTSQILPLVTLSHLSQTQIILIHESTYNPATDHVQPFSYKLFSRIDSVWIKLNYNRFKDAKVCSLESNDINEDYNYILDKHGLIFY
ncbi:MAG: ATPase domain-containing protein [Candidatus Lokiarchaeota archaeon]